MDSKKNRLEIIKKLVAKLDPNEDNTEILVLLIKLLNLDSKTTSSSVTLLQSSPTIPSNNTSDKIKNFRAEIRVLVQQNALDALIALRDGVVEDSTVLKRILLNIAKYNRIHGYLMLGTVKFEDVNTEFNKIDMAILYLIDELKEKDLK